MGSDQSDTKKPGLIKTITSFFQRTDQAGAENAMLTAEDYDRYITGLESLYRQVSDYKDLATLNTVPKKMTDILKGITGENDFYRIVLQALQAVKESIENNKKQPVSLIQSLVQTQLAELIQDTKSFRDSPAKSSPSTVRLSARETELLALRTSLEERERDIADKTALLQTAEAALQEARNALAQALEQHQQEKAEYEKRLQQSEEEMKTLWTQLGELEAEKNGLTAEKTALETTVSQLNAQRDALQSEVRGLQETTAQQKQKEDEREDAAERRKSLQNKMAGLPEGLRDFVQSLLEIADHAEKKDIGWLTERGRISALERFVYSSPESIGLLAQRNYADSDTLYQVIALQNWTHECLRAAGIEPIYPAQGDKFDVQFHDFNDRDLVYTNDKPQWNKCVHSVVQIGFFDRRNFRVLRKASIKRYYYTGNEPAPDASTEQKAAENSRPDAFSPSVSPSIETSVGSGQTSPPANTQVNRFQDMTAPPVHAAHAQTSSSLPATSVETQTPIAPSETSENGEGMKNETAQSEPLKPTAETKMEDAEVSLETAALKRVP